MTTPPTQPRVDRDTRQVLAALAICAALATIAMVLLLTGAADAILGWLDAATAEAQRLSTESGASR
jgi:hypothetical protein